ncbi:hypothetical protein DFH06DRAFT_1481074 [Mycena polygramma]|nr:hypothetical protein DFH06DRAFT_1481074 [Mycena polygramma]
MFGLTPSRILIAVFLLSATTVASAQEYSGGAFWFEPGTGSCGHTDGITDLVASVSTEFFFEFKDGSGKEKPICYHHLVAVNAANNKSVTARIVDDFTDPHWGKYGIGLSLAAFEQIGGVGTIEKVNWHVAAN